MSDPMTTGAGAGIIAKAVGLVAAVIGAGLMAATRPPATRKQLAVYAGVALGSSLLFGNQVAFAIDPYVDWVDLRRDGAWEALDYYVAVHGLVGAVSWGVWGYVAGVVERVRNSDEGIVAALKKAILGG